MSLSIEATDNRNIKEGSDVRAEQAVEDGALREIAEGAGIEFPDIVAPSSTMASPNEKFVPNLVESTSAEQSAAAELGGKTIRANGEAAHYLNPESMSAHLQATVSGQGNTPEAGSLVRMRIPWDSSRTIAMSATLTQALDPFLQKMMDLVFLLFLS